VGHFSRHPLFVLCTPFVLSIILSISPLNSENMPAFPAEDAVDRLSLDHPCPIADGYYLPVKDVTLAIIYSSSRLLAMHRAIKKPEVGTLPQYPAAFYKNLCWEVDVSPVNNPCMPSIDRLARPSSPLGSCNWLAPSLSDITIMLWT
jgi:hypothetical protein